MMILIDEKKILQKVKMKKKIDDFDDERFRGKKKSSKPDFG